MDTARPERSVALAKDVARRLEVDLFDGQRRGCFWDIKQNCLIRAYQTGSQRQVMDGHPLDAPQPHCRNKAFFSNGD